MVMGSGRDTEIVLPPSNVATKSAGEVFMKTTADRVWESFTWKKAN